MCPLSSPLLLAQLLVFADDILGEDDQNEQDESSRDNAEDTTGAHDGGKHDQHVQGSSHMLWHL